MRGLIIKDPWISSILDGKKTWEIRGRNTKIRGKIALIKSGTGMVYGTAELIDVYRLGKDTMPEQKCWHGIEDLSIIKYENIYAWALHKVEKFETPVPYNHPRGAIVWVNLKEV